MDLVRDVDEISDSFMAMVEQVASYRLALESVRTLAADSQRAPRVRLSLICAEAEKALWNGDGSHGRWA